MGNQEEQKYIGGQVHADTATAWDRFCNNLKAFSRKDMFGAAITYFLELPLDKAKARAEQYANDHNAKPANPVSTKQTAKPTPALDDQDLERIVTAAVQAALQQVRSRK